MFFIKEPFLELIPFSLGSILHHQTAQVMAALDHFVSVKVGNVPRDTHLLYPSRRLQ